MSSTNKTTHYNLSQYVASDKPTYLVDYNADMSAIDTGIYNAKSEAETNTTAIGTLSNLTTTEKSNLVGAINEVNGDLGTLSETVGDHTTAIATNTSAIGTLANLKTTNKSNLVASTNEIYDIINDYFTFNYDVINLTNSNIITGNGSFNSSPAQVTIAYNDNKTLAKIYTSVWYSAGSQTDLEFSVQSALRPSSDIDIGQAGFVQYYDSNGDWIDHYPAWVKIKTTGEVIIGTYVKPNQQNMLQIMPFMYVVTDFGDIPLNS